MKCYRLGGCGPYEMLSCNKCPASKIEYLKRYNKNIKIINDNTIQIPIKLIRETNIGTIKFD